MSDKGEAAISAGTGLYMFFFCTALFMYLLSILHLVFSFKLSVIDLFEQKAAQDQSKTLECVETTFNIFACTPVAVETFNVGNGGRYSPAVWL
ncbi:hypothetical protein GYMLUDRAFT_47552 [Collybiopsis luxurians FD-317 M1]|uniref:Uncharacterized protein n=1 Tax=Collybiopsis luxurians FD-317 M1 TaxID=944289 RepID=A0A0D0C0E4_9AGAR|nr:hypothetical protein GYMLUDRAFT_47552 [Collybiopsis luxurians FD-317 M1]